MREGFHTDLERVTATLVEMADGVTMAMRQATTALLTADADLAQQVALEDTTIDALYRRVEDRVGELLARQSLVAGDLRLTVTALHVAVELERMGDLAVHVAKTAQRRAPQVAVESPARELVTSMADHATRIGAKVSTVLRTSDAQTAAELAADDDAVDALHRQLFTVILDKASPYGVAPAIDAAQLGRWYERFGVRRSCGERRPSCHLPGHWRPALTTPAAPGNQPRLGTGRAASRAAPIRTGTCSRRRGW